MKHTQAVRRGATAILGGTLAILPALPAQADDVPVDIDQPGVQHVPAAPVTAPSTRAISQCGSGSSSYKYSSSVAFWSVDIFRHANTTGVCEDNSVITNIYEIRNDCQKYGWGVLYGSSKSYRFGPSTTPGTKTAFGTAECAMQVGGTFHGVGLQYKKQSNTEHTFSMQGTGATYTVDHWTTTP